MYILGLDMKNGKFSCELGTTNFGTPRYTHVSWNMILKLLY